jgi:hypothetical protein
MMVVFFLLKVRMARGWKLRKSGGGELEVDKENVVALDQSISEQNVVLLHLKFEEQNFVSLKIRIQIDVSRNLCGLKLTRIIVCNID